jgi:hypothetical protein
MPHTIKVSVNEWAILDRNADAELMTDGLSGCVAIAVKTHDRIGLTHVFSGAEDPEKFERYLPDIERFIEKFGGKDAIEELHLVRNSSNVYQEQDNSLTRMLARHLIDHDLANQDSMRIHRDNGCTVNGDNLYLCSKDNRGIYNRGFTNTELEYVGAQEKETLSGQLTSGTYDRGLMKFPALPSEVFRAPESGHAHYETAQSRGEAFERRPTEPAPPQRPEPQIRNETDEPHAPLNEKKRGRSALESESPEKEPPSDRFGWPKFGESPCLDQAQSTETSRSDLESQPPTKKSKQFEAEGVGVEAVQGDPIRTAVLRMLERLPEHHDFRQDPQRATDAILSFARQHGLQEITDIQPTAHGNTAVMVEGRDQGGSTQFAADALRSSEIDHHARQHVERSQQMPHPTPPHQGEHGVRLM